MLKKTQFKIINNKTFGFLKYSLGVVVSTLMLGCYSENLNLKTIQLNQAGNKLFKANTHQQALEKYINALAYNPFLSELHLNLGLAFEALQQAEKAEQSYKEAENIAIQNSDHKMMFIARFNQAQLLGKAKKIDEALEKYQKCLDIIPSSKEVKTNIELLTQSNQGQDDSDQKDKKDQDNKGNDQQKKEGQNPNENKKDQGDQNKDDKDSEGQKDQQDKKYQSSAKYKPRPFEGKELSEGDVKKILGEIKQQEAKIRAEFNRKEVKEQPRAKDW